MHSVQAAIRDSCARMGDACRIGHLLTVKNVATVYTNEDGKLILPEKKSLFSIRLLQKMWYSAAHPHKFHENQWG